MLARVFNIDLLNGITDGNLTLEEFVTNPQLLVSAYHGLSEADRLELDKQIRAFWGQQR